MKQHLVGLHKSLSQHHGRIAKIHGDHAEALDDGDVQKGHHLAMSQEHEKMSKYHKDAATVLDELPEVERVDTGDLHGPKKAAWVHGDPLASVRGALPDNEDYKKRLEDRGLRTVSRAGQPGFDDVFGDGLEAAAAQLDPELRKAIV